MTAAPGRPLAGLEILDLSMFVAGPFATSTLADLGAGVLKIEPPAGDPMRRSRVGPVIGGASAQYHTFNRGKRSLVLDLKCAAGREVFRALVAQADVVFSNFRPGVMRRLGLEHPVLEAINPRIVSVSLSAFGSDGPWAERPGYDLVVQALGGAMSLTGHPETGPAHIPFHIGDTAGGLYAAIAILAAVLEARASGRGRALEVAMLDVQMSLLGDEVTNDLTGQWPGDPHGAGFPGLAPYAAYATADDPIVIAAVGVEQFWLNLLAALDLRDLAEDPRFRGNDARCAHRAELDAILQPVLRRRGRAEWLAAFAAADVPAAPVLGLHDAVRSDQVRARRLISWVPAGADGEAGVVAPPIRPEGGDPWPPPGGAPALGAGGRAVLRERLGFSEAALAELGRRGAFGPDPGPGS